MSAESPKSGPSEEWQKTWFENAHSEIRWSKEQSWRVVEGAVLLLAAVAAAATSLPGLSVGWAVGLVVAVWLLAAVYVLDLHQSAVKSRKRCAQIAPNPPGPARKFDPNHLFYLFAQLAVVAVAGVLVVLVVSDRRTPTSVASPAPIEWHGLFYENPTNMRGAAITRELLAVAPKFRTLEECTGWGVRESASHPNSGFQCAYGCRQADSALIDDTVCKDATSIIRPR